LILRAAPDPKASRIKKIQLGDSVVIIRKDPRFFHSVKEYDGGFIFVILFATKGFFG
jgi:hypothetical protein